MADYAITNVARRIVYTGSAGVGPYAFSFPIIVNTDIAVYKNDAILTLTTDYTVTISGTTGTGSVTLVSAATGSDRITIVGARPIQRSTDFVTGGDFLMTTEAQVFCPYCAEEITLVVDCSEDEQTYTEDCFVCCRPILISVHSAEGELVSVDVRREN